MLPEMILDTDNFDEIFEEARGKIASIYPEWTDYNYHDPGITLLELFSWLLESQEYYLDQIGEDHKKKYLKLLGEQRRKKVPAKALLNLDTTKNFILPKHSKFYADDICFETTETNYMVKDDIVKCFFARSRIVELMDRRQLNFGHKLKMYMFGTEPEKGDIFYIGLDSSLPTDAEISIYFDMFSDYPVKRNPIEEALASPFISYEVEYYCQDGWKAVSNLTDKTFGFLKSGQIFFRLDRPMETTEYESERAYYIRIRMTDGIYDVPPIIQGFGINVFTVSQRNRLIESTEIKKVIEKGKKIFFSVDTFLSIYGANDVYIQKDGIFYPVSAFEKYVNEENQIVTFCVDMEYLGASKKNLNFLLISYMPDEGHLRELGEGNGYPNQMINLYDENLDYDSFSLLVQDILHPDGYVRWEKVEDFGDSEPDDLHFILDSVSGLVKFGDSIHGMAPEGRILVCDYATTLGAGGNVKAGKIDKLSSYLASEATVLNQEESHGGLDEESLEESFLRVRELLKKPNTAVTYEDYENYVRKTPGLMIANCKVLSRQDIEKIFPYQQEVTITIVVKPYEKKRNKMLGKIYQRNILAYLETYRMAGTSILLLPPVYNYISVYLEVSIYPQFVNAKGSVREAVVKYFDEISNTFGVTVSYIKLYGILDMLNCVSRVNGLSFDAKGTGITRLPDQSILLAPHGVAVLEQVEVSYSLEQ